MLDAAEVCWLMSLCRRHRKLRRNCSPAQPVLGTKIICCDMKCLPSMLQHDMLQCIDDTSVSATGPWPNKPTIYMAISSGLHCNDMYAAQLSLMGQRHKHLVDPYQWLTRITAFRRIVASSITTFQILQNPVLKWAGKSPAR